MRPRKRGCRLRCRLQIRSSRCGLGCCSKEDSSTSHFLAIRPIRGIEQIALWVVLLIAVAGLVYAVALVGQVYGADEGTEKMREVGAAIRQGANAYLGRQFRAIVLLVFRADRRGVFHG